MAAPTSPSSTAEPALGRRSRAFWAAGAIVLAAVVVIAGYTVLDGTWTRGTRSTGSAPIPPTSFTVVAYNSSVDGFPLSFDEWLPDGFVNSDRYALIVYLHGQQDTSGAWYPGGLTSDLVQSLTNSSD